MALTQPDPGVLRKAQRGDERAFTLIVRAYERPVYNYVLRLVGDRSLAEDLTQEVFIRVFQGLPGFSLRSRFGWSFHHPPLGRCSGQPLHPINGPIDEQDNIRPHVRFFVNGERVFDLDAALRPEDEVQIVQASSGG